MNNGPSFVTISYEGYDKDIPIKYNYSQFVEEFKKIFDIYDEIKSLKFNLTLETEIENKKETMEFELCDEDDYKIVFTSEENIKSQFQKIIGIPNIKLKINIDYLYNLRIKFLNKENNENIITKSISEIQKNKPINYEIKILTIKNRRKFPEKTFLICVPDDSDIYFPHVAITDKLNDNTTLIDGSLQYVFKIKIKFKNYKNIVPGEKKLKAKIIYDECRFINIYIGEIIVFVQE